MASRIDLHNKFIELLDSEEVYFQKPENKKMSYPAIVYTVNSLNFIHADNLHYRNLKSYKGIVISKLPDPEVFYKIMELPYTAALTPYVADNLNHYPFVIYY